LESDKYIIWGIGMKVFIVYCHPSKDSFTNDVYKSFERGLRDAGHEILISDFLRMFSLFLRRE